MSLEVADTEELRANGLMGRTSIVQGGGMLFSFPESDVRYFWMKNVPFDIEIGFFDSKGSFVSYKKMTATSPLQNEEKLPRYSSEKEAQFAVEVPVGFFSSQKQLKTCRLSPVPAVGR